MSNEEKDSGNEIIIGPPRFRLLPEGSYRATLLRIDNAKGAYENDVYEPWFEIDQGPHGRSEIKDMINKKNSSAKNSKLCHMIRALEPSFKLEEFNRVNLGDLIGKRCYIKVARRGKNNAIVEYFQIQDFKDIE